MSGRRLAWRVAIVAAGLLLGLVVLLPLRLALSALALDQAGLSARSVSGTVWSGRIEEMRLGRASIGTVDTALAPLPLLLGRARLSMQPVASQGRAGPSGAVVVGRHLIGADLTGSVAIGGLIGDLPITSLDLDQVTVRFLDGACLEAHGAVRARLAGPIALLGLTDGFQGQVRCAGRSLAASLSSQSGQARLALRVDGDARYRADLIVAEPDATLAPLLSSAGFVIVPGGYRLRATGLLR